MLLSRNLKSPEKIGYGNKLENAVLFTNLRVSLCFSTLVEVTFPNSIMTFYTQLSADGNTISRLLRLIVYP